MGRRFLTEERRLATVLFADMLASTAQAEKLGEEANYFVLKRAIGLLVDAVSEYSGTVQDPTDDGAEMRFFFSYVQEVAV